MDSIFWTTKYGIRQWNLLQRRKFKALDAKAKKANTKPTQTEQTKKGTTNEKDN